MKNYQRGFIGVFPITIIVIVAIGVGAYFYIKNTQHNITTDSAYTNYGSEAWSVENSFDSNWKTLKNGKYKFSFEIPYEAKDIQLNPATYGNPDYTVLFESPTYQTIMVGGGEETYPTVERGYNISVTIKSGSFAKTIKDLQDFNKLGRGGPAYVDEKLIKVSGEDALTYSFTQPNGGKGYVLWLLKKDGTWLDVSVGFKGVDGDTTFKRIISSMNFI